MTKRLEKPHATHLLNRAEESEAQRGQRVAQVTQPVNPTQTDCPLLRRNQV